MPLQSGLTLALLTELTKAGSLGSATQKIPYSYGFEWADGTGLNQADRLYQATRTLAASATEDLDLAGVLLDPFGAAITFVKIQAMLFKASAANTNNVVIGAASATQFVGPFGAATHTIAVKPGGLFLTVAPDAAGWAVGAGASDLLKVANSGAGTGVTYDIFLIGKSA